MSFWSRIERRIGEFAEELLPDEYRARLIQAHDAAEAGKFEAASVILAELLAERPTHVPTLILMGWVELRCGRAADAHVLYERALGQDEDNAEALIGVGQASLFLERPEEAMGAFQKAVRKSGGQRALLAEAYAGLGKCHLVLGHVDKALRELRKAVTEGKGDDALVLSNLADALLAHPEGSHDEAEKALLEATSNPNSPVAAWVSLGRIALARGDTDEAILRFERVIEGRIGGAEFETTTDCTSILRAFQGLIEANLERSDIDRAEELLAAAQSSFPSDSTLASLRGRSCAIRGQISDALTHYQRSLTAQNSAAVALEALQLALRHNELRIGVDLANRVLSSDPNSPDAQTMRALDLVQRGEVDAARATLEHILKDSDDYEALVALAALLLHEGESKKATQLLDKALLSPASDERALRLYQRSNAQALGIKLSGDSGWFDLATSFARLCAKHPALHELSPLASMAVSEFDQPLLVAVMGEFSSGKSSFVNAFIGAEVAPTGILPTTATINIVKFGRDRGGRILYRDNQSRELDTTKLHDELASIDDEEARRVQHVEILMPQEILERVNIIDTPGLNSILPEHEAVARTFLQRADAVVWLFTANQAGKSTEKSALDSIRDKGVRVLGVLNKVDQLGDGEVDEILRYVHEELGPRVEALVPISAQAAIEDRKSGGFPTLERELEERFFTQARKLKRQALLRRLDDMSLKAATVATSLDEEKGAEERYWQERAQATVTVRAQLADRVRRERAELATDCSKLYRDAAHEILELVRPRRVPFGSHKTAIADRDYLIGRLERGYLEVLGRSRLRVHAQLGSEIYASSTDSASSDAAQWRERLDQQLVAARSLLDARLFDSKGAYLRGFLRGGCIDEFFRERLPKIELDEDAIFTSLLRILPDLPEELSSELERASYDFSVDLEAGMRRNLRLAKAQGLRAKAGLEEALRLFDEHKARLAASL